MSAFHAARPPVELAARSEYRIPRNMHSRRNRQRPAVQQPFTSSACSKWSDNHWRGKEMRRIPLLLILTLFSNGAMFGQSASFGTYMNPLILGDHPYCMLLKVGNDFYTTGSSFNPTPVIYHSTDLVHWEAVSRPVSAAWSASGDWPRDVESLRPPRQEGGDPRR